MPQEAQYSQAHKARQAAGLAKPKDNSKIVIETPKPVEPRYSLPQDRPHGDKPLSQA